MDERVLHRKALRGKLQFGKGFDTDPPQVGAGTPSVCCFSRVLVVFLGLPAGFPTFPSLF